MTQKRNITLVLGLFLSLLCAVHSNAQQEAMTAQFIVNKLFINPAYAGSKEGLNTIATQRSQWLGLKGAPSSSIVMFDNVTRRKALAYGGGIVFDKAGPASKFGVSGDLAYRIRFTNRSSLSFGMKAALDIFQVSLTDLAVPSQHYGQQDDIFSNNQKGVLLPNIGFGIYYYKKNHFFGISVPKMIRNSLAKKGSVTSSILSGKQEPTLYLMAGKIFKINQDLRIQPNTIIKAERGAPISIGVFANVIFAQKFTTGLFMHYRENVGMLLQWQINKQFKIGYSIDLPTTKLLTVNYGSHELSFSYSLESTKNSFSYPHYF